MAGWPARSFAEGEHSPLKIATRSRPLSLRPAIAVGAHASGSGTCTCEGLHRLPASSRRSDREPQPPPARVQQARLVRSEEYRLGIFARGTAPRGREAPPCFAHPSSLLLQSTWPNIQFPGWCCQVRRGLASEESSVHRPTARQSQLVRRLPSSLE